MLYSSFRRSNVLKTVIFVFLLTFLIYPAEPVDAAITANWGDLVEVHYLLFTNPNYTGTPEENNTLDNVYLTTGSTVPDEVTDLFPSASANWFPEFKSGIIGIAVGGSKRFSAYGNEATNYFEVTLLEILYDAVVEGSTSSTTTTTTTNSINDPLGGLGNIILFGGGGAIIAGGLISWAIISYRRNQVLSTETSSVSRRQKSIKKSKTKLKELRELAEARGSDSVEKKPVNSSDIKFRRRK